MIHMFNSLKALYNEVIDFVKPSTLPPIPWMGKLRHLPKVTCMIVIPAKLVAKLKTGH